jgi:hypothetical protein
MNNFANDSDPNSTPYLPKTEEEKAEAFRLLDELEKELARRAAFREVLVESLAGCQQD